MTNEKRARAEGTRKRRKWRKGGTDSPGPVYGQKSQVPKKGGRASRKRPRKDKEAEVRKANQPSIEKSWSHTKSQISQG